MVSNMDQHTEAKNKARNEAKERLEAAVQQIEEIRALFQTPSFSIGVVLDGETIFTRGFGLANVETKRVPDEKTIYGVGSITKAFTGTACALLSQAGKFELSDPVSSKIKGLETDRNPGIAEKEMTIADMLSHCSGLSTMPYVVCGKGGAVFARKEDVVHIVNNLPRVASMREKWMYNNWPFALAGVLVDEQADGLSYGQYIADEILNKIGMTRTGTTSSVVDDNHAVPYLVFDGQDPQAAKLPVLDDGCAFDASGSLRSCVADMLLWTKALMRAWNMSKSGSLPGVPGRSSADEGETRLWKALAKVQEPRFPITQNDKAQQYCLGLFRLQLPTPEMNFITNGGINNTEYILGEDSPKRLAIGHHGDYGGFLSAYWTFPESNSSVVVLANSFNINGDPTNIMAQLLIQALFDLQPKVDFVSVARQIVDGAKSRFVSVLRNWENGWLDGKNRRCPESTDPYTGVFTNEGLAMRIKIEAVEKGDPFNSNFPDNLSLRLTINENSEQVFGLCYYCDNAWTFLPNTSNDCIAKGYKSYLSSWKSFIIQFGKPGGDGNIGELQWVLDPDIKRVQSAVFTRTG